MDPDLSFDYVTTLLAALLIGTGFVLQQHAAEMEPDSRFLSVRLITDLLRKPRWLAGIVCMVLGQVLAAWSIGHLELTVIEPLLTTNLLFALLLAVPLAGAKLRVHEVAGALILCTGVGLLSAARSVTPIGLSFGSFSDWWVAAVVAGIAFILVHAGHRRSGRVRAALTGTAAGLVFGIQDALTRQTLDALQGNSWTVLLSTWSAYALVATGAVGIWLMQNAFSAGPLQASLPAISAGEPLVGILLGVIVFGDSINVSPGMLALQAGGLLALIVGVITVASAPALSQLREQASKIRSAVTPARHDADAPADADADAAQNEAAPGEAAHTEAPPAGALSPPEPAPGEASSGEASCGEASCGEAVAGEASCGEAVAGEASCGEAVAGEASSGEAAAREGEAAAREVAAGEAAPGEAAPGKSATSEPSPGETAPRKARDAAVTGAAGDEAAPNGARGEAAQDGAVRDIAAPDGTAQGSGSRAAPIPAPHSSPNGTSDTRHASPAEPPTAPPAGATH